MSTGWFRVYRKLFDHDLWLLEPFTRGQAWIDLVGNANHKEGSFMIRGNLVTVKRGQIGWSEVSMAKRWRWSRNKVRRFLKWLETEQQIEQQKDRYLTTIITILNYAQYQPMEQQTIQQKDSRQNINNNVKKNKNKNIPSSYSSLSGLTPEVLGEIAARYRVSVSSVKQLREELELYCSSKGKTYKDYKAALMNWTMRRIEEGKLQPLSVSSGGSIMEALRKAGRNDL